MKISVSLPAEDVAILDEFASKAGLASRSAAVQHAVRMLRWPELDQDYATAWDEWEASGGSAAWDRTAADGFSDVAR